MRQGQQNRRGRGRNNNNNRKGHNHHNPLMRTYQSNGPDQKIHGTPAQIAEKYMSLARDALSSGDPVLAENYLQHAEHYNRIILTYREQQMQQGGDMNGGGMGRTRPFQGEGFDAGEDSGDDEGDDMQPGEASMIVRGNEPQPRTFEQPQPRMDDRPPRQHGDGMRGDGARGEQGHRETSFRDQTPREGGREHGHREHGGHREGGHREGGHRDGHRPFRQRMGGEPRQYGQDRGDRMGRGERPDRGDRPDRMDRAPRSERPERPERPERTDRIDAVATERVPEPVVPVAEPPPAPVIAEPPAPVAAPPARRRERFAEPQHEQPEFLRRPVRRPRREVEAQPAGDSEPAPLVADDPPRRD